MPDVAVWTQGTGAEVLSKPQGDSERLTDALTRIAAESGYPTVEIEQITASAGLSVDAFHEHFLNKDQCLLLAYDRFLGDMLEHIEEACEEASDWPDKVKITIEAAFEYVVDLEAVARLFVVDTMRTGAAGLERRCASVDSAALRLKHGRVVYPTSADFPEAMEGALVAGVVMIAVTHLLSEDADRLPSLAPEAVEMVLTPYIGSRRAQRIAST
jgi:AcrR family transcriptional regulator